jgi:hypothetical protein
MRFTVTSCRNRKVALIEPQREGRIGIWTTPAASLPGRGASLRFQPRSGGRDSTMAWLGPLISTSLRQTCVLNPARSCRSSRGESWCAGLGILPTAQRDVSVRSDFH